MEETELKEMTNYIFSTGKMVHSLVFRAQNSFICSMKTDSGLRDISMAQMTTLIVVRKEGPLSITGLSKLLNVSPPSASTMVNRLVDKGLLTRELSSEDRRKVVVKISAPLIKELDACEASILNIFEDLVEKIGKETANKWCEVLEKVKTVLEKEMR